MSVSPKRFFNGLLRRGSIRSREEQRWCRVDDFPSGSYNYRFLRTRAKGDFLRNPDYLWSPNPYWDSRAGLNAHVRQIAEELGGLVTSDATVVLSQQDFEATRRSRLECWEQAAHVELKECFEHLLDSQGYQLAMPGRGFRLEVLRDGDLVKLGLRPGEFATALLDNRYLGPQDDSVPLVEVFVAAGGGQFSSAGTFYSDQLAFTIGAHPLDNYTMDSLGDSAVYTVHRFPNQPGLHHAVNGERTDRLVLKSGRAHGAETIQVVDTVRGRAILEVMLVSSRAPEVELPLAGERSGRMPGAVASNLPFAPGLGGPVEGTILPEDLDLAALGALSVIPEGLPERIHTLSERGCLLQQSQFHAVLRGYTMDLDRSGFVAPSCGDPVARFEVCGRRVRLVARSRDLVLDGRPMREGEHALLGGATYRISWRGGDCDFQSLRRADTAWPYVARLDTMRRSTPLAEGTTYSVGRDAGSCDVPLPDRKTTSNILWKDGKSGATVGVRGGRVAADRLRTDAILVASRAAEIDLSADRPRLKNPSSTCPLYVLRTGDRVLPVPTGGELELEPGDELIIGNQVFVLLAPGESEIPSRGRVETQLSPETVPSERLSEGPGRRGRRPVVGGRAGQLVGSRTHGALLGISPAAAREEPSGPVVVPLRPSVPTGALEGAVEQAPARVSEVGDVAELASVSLEAVPEEPAAPLPLVADPQESVDSSFWGEEPFSIAETAITIVDEKPCWEGYFAAEGLDRSSAGSRASGVEEAPPTASENVESTVEEASDPDKALPPGLQVPGRVEGSRSSRLLRGRGRWRLPTFGLGPGRRSSGSPSSAGD